MPSLAVTPGLSACATASLAAANYLAREVISRPDPARLIDATPCPAARAVRPPVGAGRAGRIRYRRNSTGNAFGMRASFQRGQILAGRESTELGQSPVQAYTPG
jgi:hypothetical protein